MKKILIITLILSFNSLAKSETLKNLAQASNAFLAISDLLLDEKTKSSKLTCQLKIEKISPASQSLKALIDQKVQLFVEKDFRIIESRLATCKNDCSCDIYAYAFKSKDQKIAADFSKKAEATTNAERLKCYKKISSFCTSSIYKSIINP